MTWLKKPFDAETHMEVLPNLIAHTPRLADKVLCDFCGADVPVYVYAADRMRDGTLVRCWRWMACKQCAQAVDTNNWDVIEQRALPCLRKLMQSHGILYPKPHLMKMALKHSLQEFKDWACEEEL